MNPNTRTALFSAASAVLNAARDLYSNADPADGGTTAPIVSSMLASALMILQALQTNGQPNAPVAPARLNPSHR